MKIVIAGGTGFLGRALSRALAADGHQIVILSRRNPPPAAPVADGRISDVGSAGGRTSGRPTAPTGEAGRIIPVHWVPDGTLGPWTTALDDAAAVVNLAGESIAEGRWSPARKKRLEQSRVLAIRSLARAVQAQPVPAGVFISGSAVGYYGFRGDESLTEREAAGGDFLARVCVQWEAEARAVPTATRLVLIRTGMVLERDGGALPKMLLPFRLFVGGPLGTGRQYISWIHRDDWVGLVRWALTSPVAGPVNATAPHPVTNSEFSATLGHAIGRPSWLPAPAFAMRLVLGEMADALLLNGQRVIPARALDAGFRFRYPDLAPALQAIFLT